MSDIKVTLTLTSTQALAALKQFVNEADGEMAILKQSFGGNPLGNLEQSVNNTHAAAARLRYGFEAISHAVRSANGSPSQMLFAIGDVLRLSGSVGVSFGALGVGALALAPVVADVALAFQTYKQNVAAAEVETRVMQQDISIQERGYRALDEALKRGIISGKDWMKIQNELLQGHTILALKNMQELGLSESQIKAFDKLKKMNEEMTTDSLDGMERERAKAQDVFREKIDQIEKLAGIGQHEGEIPRQNQSTVDEAWKAESAATAELNRKLADLDFQDRQKYDAELEQARLKTKESFAKIVEEENRDLERKLNLDAAEAGKSREEMYQHEYDLRTDLLTRQLYAGEIEQKQYTDATEEATAKRLAAMNAEREQARLLGLELQRIAQERRKQADESVLSDPFASQKSKEAALADMVAQTKAALEQNQADLAAAKSQKERLELLREQLSLENQLGALEKQQAQEKKQIEAAQLQGTLNMFHNMGEAAKMFGKTGVEVYKGFAIAQATIDTAKAAIAAYSSVVGIPYVGPILAPIAAAAAVAAGAAQIAAIEAASAREFGGPVTAGEPYIVGERRPELFVPSSSGYIYPTVPSRSSLDSSREQPVPGQGEAPQVHLHIVDSAEAARQRAQRDPGMEHWVVDVVNRNAHRIRGRSTQ